MHMCLKDSNNLLDMQINDVKICVMAVALIGCIQDAPDIDMSWSYIKPGGSEVYMFFKQRE